MGPRLPRPAHGLLLLLRRTPALLQTPARKNPRDSETREHHVISRKRRPPPSCSKCTGSLFILHLRENEGRERPCAALRQASLWRTVRLKSPPHPPHRLRGLGTHTLQFAFLSSPQKS